MIRKKGWLSLTIVLFLFASTYFAGFAQEEEEGLTLRVIRDFGYGGGRQIQGRFSMRASGPEDLTRVEFLIDGEVVFDDLEPPFRYSFSTDDFPPGMHRMSAIGYLKRGEELGSATFTYEFISADEAKSAAVKFVLPLLVVLGGVSLVALIGPALLGRRKGAFRIGEYGAAGGAVCPRCTFPYSRHMLSPNLVLGKLERCPHCGRWALVRRASSMELEAAEARLQQDGMQGRRSIESQDDQELKRLLEDSRFEE